MNDHPNLFSGGSDEPQPLHNGHHNSREAADSVRPTTGAQREKVFSAIYERGPDGATCDEIERALGGTHQAISARFHELAGRQRMCTAPARIVELPPEFRRRTRSGRPAGVYVATQFAPEWIMVYPKPGQREEQQ